MLPPALKRDSLCYGAMYGLDNIEALVERCVKMLDLWQRRFETVAAFSKGVR